MNSLRDIFFVREDLPEWAEKFVSKINIANSTEECWDWKDKPNSWGYGIFHVIVNGKRRSLPAHRKAYELVHGEIGQSKIVVRHRCDRTICCNPFHLSDGSQADNMNDKVKRNRQARGSRHGMSVFTEPQVMAFRRLHKDGWKVSELARFAGVNQFSLWDVIHRHWRHLN